MKRGQLVEWIWLASKTALLVVLAGVHAHAQLPPESEHVIPFKVLFTGNTGASIDVCGCPVDVRGGVAARAYVIEEELAEVERLLLLDAGGLFQGKEATDRKRAEVYLQAMSLMNYTAMLVGETELLYGYDFLAEQLGKWGLPAVASNIVVPTDVCPPWESILLVEFPRLRVALIGLAANDPELLPEGFAISDPIEAASEAVQRIGDSADLILALSTLPFEQEKNLLRAVPEIHLLLSGQMGRPLQRVYGAFAGHSGKGGQEINVIRATYKPILESRPFSFLVTPRNVRPERGVNPVVQDHVEQFYESVRQEALPRMEQLKRLSEQPVENLAGNSYVGSSTCAKCHTNEYEQWKHTRHSSAMLSLLNLNRHYLPECLTCHTTGYGYPGGFGKVELESTLAGVGCESCHGPGGLHLQQSQRKDWIRAKVPDAICRDCHDEKNDPDFLDNAKQKRKTILHTNVPPGFQQQEPKSH